MSRLDAVWTVDQYDQAMGHRHITTHYRHSGIIIITVIVSFGCSGLTKETVVPKSAETDRSYLLRVMAEMTGITREFAEYCAEGNGNACHAVGIRFEEAGGGLPRSLAGALRLYRLGCGIAHSQSCLALARALKVSGRAASGAKVLSSQCLQKRDWFACSEAAFGISDANESLGLHKKACDSGVAKSCFLVGKTARKAARFEEAMLVFRKACNSGLLDACHAYASLQVRGCFESDPEMSDGRLQSCIKSYRSQPDEWWQWRTGCERNMPLACALSTRLDFVDKKPSDGMRRLNDACQSGEPIACHMLAGLNRIGRYTHKDLKRALQLYSLACHQGSPHGCFYAAMGQWALDGDTVRLRSLQVLVKMCSERLHEPSCRWLTSNCVRPGDCP